jgi:hypothetical protein
VLTNKIAVLRSLSLPPLFAAYFLPMFEGLDDPMLAGSSPLTLQDLFDVLADLAQLEMAYFYEGRTYIVLRLESSSIEPPLGAAEVGKEWSVYIVDWNPHERRLSLKLPPSHFFTACELLLVREADLGRQGRADVRYLLRSGCKLIDVDVAGLHPQTVRRLYRLCLRAALQTMVHSGPTASFSLCFMEPRALELRLPAGSELKFLRESRPRTALVVHRSLSARWKGVWS